MEDSDTLGARPDSEAADSFFGGRGGVVIVHTGDVEMPAMGLALKRGRKACVEVAAVERESRS